MPFTVLVIVAFLLAMVFDKPASKRSYLFFAAGAAAATIYFMR